MPQRAPLAPPRSTRAVRATLAVVAFAASAAPATLHAQSGSPFASAFAYAYQPTDLPNQYQNTVPAGCFGSDAGAGAVSAAFASCTIPPNVNGVATAHAMSAFDPAAGTFKTGAFLSLHDYTLAQFIPTYDAGGDRVYTGLARPDVLGVYTAISLSDFFTFDAAPGSVPATVNLMFDWNGLLRADALPDGVTTQAASFINFCTSLVNVCGTPQALTDAFYGNAGVNAFGDGSMNFSSQGNAPAGANPATIEFDGTAAGGVVAGRITLADIPVLVGSEYAFNFAIGALVAAHHSTAAMGNIPPGCDPARDGPCPPLDLVDPVDVTGELFADFTHTLAYAGYQVFDANGNDITASVKLNFASGLAPIPGPTAVPEPGTLALLGGGLAAVVGLRRRRRA